MGSEDLSTDIEINNGTLRCYPQWASTMWFSQVVLLLGVKDVVRYFVPGRDGYENVDGLCQDMRITKIIEGAGHWVQQEFPEQVNASLLKFLATLS